MVLVHTQAVHIMAVPTVRRRAVLMDRLHEDHILAVRDSNELCDSQR